MIYHECWADFFDHNHKLLARAEGKLIEGKPGVYSGLCEGDVTTPGHATYCTTYKPGISPITLPVSSYHKSGHVHITTTDLSYGERITLDLTIIDNNEAKEESTTSGPNNNIQSCISFFDKGSNFLGRFIEETGEASGRFTGPTINSKKVSYCCLFKSDGPMTNLIFPYRGGKHSLINTVFLSKSGEIKLGLRPDNSPTTEKRPVSSLLGPILLSPLAAAFVVAVTTSLVQKGHLPMNFETFFNIPFVRDTNVVAYASTLTLGLAFIGWGLLKTMGRTMAGVGEHFRNVRQEKKDRLTRSLKENREEIAAMQKSEREWTERLSQINKDEETRNKTEEAERIAHIIKATLQRQSILPVTTNKPAAGCWIRFIREANNGAQFHDTVRGKCRTANKGDIVQVVDMTSSGLCQYLCGGNRYVALHEDIEVIS